MTENPYDSIFNDTYGNDNSSQEKFYQYASTNNKNICYPEINNIYPTLSLLDSNRKTENEVSNYQGLEDNKFSNYKIK